MRTSSEIYFDFTNARRQADRLDSLADKLSRQTVKGMEQTTQSASQAWTGDNGSKYVQKGADLKNQINETVTELRSVAADIRSAAQRVYNAEMEALRIAQQRRSGK